MLVFHHLNSSLLPIFDDLFKPFKEQQFFEENDAQWKAAVRTAAWCYKGEIEKFFVSWEDPDTDTDPHGHESTHQNNLMRVNIWF